MVAKLWLLVPLQTSLPSMLGLRLSTLATMSSCLASSTPIPIQVRPCNPSVSNISPAFSGLLTREPTHWIAPYVGFPTYEDVKAYWKSVNAKTAAGQGIFFNGLDRSLQLAPELTRQDLDEFFPTRPVIVLDNSGHEVYFNTEVVKYLKWEKMVPPADPVGARFGRGDDGTSNGRAYETAAVLAAVGPLIPFGTSSCQTMESLPLPSTVIKVNFSRPTTP
jgi:hypothetical protein